MAVLFQPDLVLPRDPIGFGQWLQGHGYEHLRMATLAANLATPAVIPDYDLFYWSENDSAIQSWLVYHEQIHEALRVPANVTGIDLSAVDLKSDEEFFTWMDDHSSEHIALRNFFGAT